MRSVFDLANVFSVGTATSEGDILFKTSAVYFMIEERLVPSDCRDEEILNQHLARYSFASAFVKGKRVLDIACGSGYGSAMLSEAGRANMVVGMDLSEDAVRYAKRHYPKANLEFVVGNAEEISELGNFDVVTSFETIEHLHRPEKFVHSVVHVLSSDGMFFVSTPIREGGSITDRPRNPFHDREWTLEEFREMLHVHFSEVTIFGQYNFEKTWFPYGRTMKRAIARLIMPKKFHELDLYDVRERPPMILGFSFVAIYAVALCRHAKK